MTRPTLLLVPLVSLMVVAATPGGEAAETTLSVSVTVVRSCTIATPVSPATPSAPAPNATLSCVRGSARAVDVSFEQNESRVRTLSGSQLGIPLENAVSNGSRPPVLTVNF